MIQTIHPYDFSSNECTQWLKDNPDSMFEIELVYRPLLVDESELSEKDIEITMHQCHCTRNSAVKALQQENNDLVNAIMLLTMRHELKVCENEISSERVEKWRIEHPNGVLSIDFNVSFSSVSESELLEKDINLVINQTNCSRKDAIKTMCKEGGDIVNSIMSLTV